MKINRKTHLEIRLQNLLFSALFLAVIGLLAWLSTEYSIRFDWTAGHQHTLSSNSLKVLELFKEPVTVTAYARENQQVREPIRELVDRYNEGGQTLALDFINPDTQPDRVRQWGIKVDGELVLTYQGRTEKIEEAREMTLTNALQRLVAPLDREIVFLSGHGERAPEGEASHDLKQFTDELKRKGFKVSTLNLAATPKLPTNNQVLVIASPRSAMLPGEIKLIQNYVAAGGALWWLSDPGSSGSLQPLAENLGIQFLSGTVVDASTQLLGIDDPTFALVADYPPHPITKGFQEMTVFPSSVAMVIKTENDFERDPFLITLERSWTETSPLEGKIAFDAALGEKRGPLDIGIALNRPKPNAPVQSQAVAPDSNLPAKPSEQRLVIIGDGDFLSNAYLGNGGNLALGVNILQWLSQSDTMINIQKAEAPDRKIQLSSIASGAMAIGFLFVVPFLLIGTGAFVWFKRRNR